MTDQEIAKFMAEYCTLSKKCYTIKDGTVYRNGSIGFNARARSLTAIPFQLVVMKGAIQCCHLENVTDFSFVSSLSELNDIYVYSDAQLCENLFKVLLLQAYRGTPYWQGSIIRSRYQAGTTAEERSPRLDSCYVKDLGRYAPTDYARAALATMLHYLRGWHMNSVITAGRLPTDCTPRHTYSAVKAPYASNVRYSYVGHHYRLCFTKANDRDRLVDHIGYALRDYNKTKDFIALKAALAGTRYDKYLMTILAETQVISPIPVLDTL